MPFRRHRPVPDLQLDPGATVQDVVRLTGTTGFVATGRRGLLGLKLRALFADVNAKVIFLSRHRPRIARNRNLEPHTHPFHVTLTFPPYSKHAPIPPLTPNP